MGLVSRHIRASCDALRLVAPLIDARPQREAGLFPGESGGLTFMPKVTTVMSILKSRASASCHSAVYRLGPAGRSAKLLAMPVFDTLAGCGEEGGET